MIQAFWHRCGRPDAEPGPARRGGRRPSRRRSAPGSGLAGPELLEGRALLAAPAVVSTLAGTAGTAGSADGTGASALFDMPGGIAVVVPPVGFGGFTAGLVYAADSGNDTIREVTPAGVVTTLAGSPGQAGSADGTAAAARFDDPTGVAWALNTVFVADSRNDTVREIIGNNVTTLAGAAGQAGSADGTGASARFDDPTGVATTWGGEAVYVADSHNDTIRVVDAYGGPVTTLAGAAGQAGSADGTGAAARFNDPTGVAVDAAGNLYVADAGNDTVRRITPAGVVTTLAGAAGQAGSADGTAAAARFRQPGGIAIDPAGNVDVADTGNDTVRKITSAPPSAVFVIEPDNQVYSEALTPSGVPTGGGYDLTATGQVKAMTAVRLPGTVNFETLVIGVDNQVRAATINGGTKNGYFNTAWGSIASITAGTDGSGNPLMFGIGTDKQLYEQAFDAGGNPLSTQYTKVAPGVFFTQAVLTHDASGNPLLYAVGTDNEVYGLRMDAGGAPVGGLFPVDYGPVRQLVAGNDASGNPELFAIGSDTGVYAHRLDATGGPVGGFVSLGGEATAIAEASNGNGDPEVVVIGTDGQVYHQVLDAAGNPLVGYGVNYNVENASSIAAGTSAAGSAEIWDVSTADGQVYSTTLDVTGQFFNGPFTLSSPGRVKSLVVV